MLRPLYDWTLKQAARPNAEKVLAAISFAESSFFPIPPDVMLAPMALAKPEKAYRLAFICTVASVIGGLFGYAIGYYLADIGLKILGLFGYSGNLDSFHAIIQEWGAWAILIKGLTPIPFKLVTIASGMGQLNLAIFFICCVITRGARFYLTAFLLKRFGPQARELIEKRINLVAIAGVAVIVLGIVAVKFMH
ncbi:DedA family protein [Asticcacaulis sp. DW145]|uniref:DedA family protein n=1 Tax=Asticcacaulis currens TaxID=2984210 RepID=A0ABT5IC45_9CAUL|nr:YqaA family protein [Asticcacaulis currens]MDC7693756.1 DedA family protein [Asticcacaulis currens]BEV10283.1 DedA family protein [Asticcacaulis sp. DW145]